MTDQSMQQRRARIMNPSGSMGALLGILPGHLHSLITHLDYSSGRLETGRRQCCAGCRHVDLRTTCSQPRHTIPIKLAGDL